MRGTLGTFATQVPNPGIIPAYAGNTAVRNFFRYLYRDHPRICGEHGISDSSGGTRSGSSPHMRGTHAFNLANGLIGGIIPAYAGNTWADSPFCLRARDHPRICGEHAKHGNQVMSREGSSPHMRGTLAPLSSVTIFTGIIPAYAGNTMACRRLRRAHWDHPRICGEHDGITVAVKQTPGSSPHMRGTQELK